MSAVQYVLNSFDKLPVYQKKEVASEILRRTVQFEIPSLSDEDLILNAENLFLDLDQREKYDEPC